jgi:hypothetical protein
MKEQKVGFPVDHASLVCWAYSGCHLGVNRKKKKIALDLVEIRWEGVCWIHPARVRFRWQVF